MTKYPPKKAIPYIFKPAIKHNWSEYQKAIFKNISQGDGHLIIEAYAGAAKTTSIIESFKYVPKGKKSIALAFNKRIQEELQSRAPSYIETFTFHSLGFRAIKQRFGKVELDDYKVFNLVKDQLAPHNDFDLITNICNTVAFCKYGLLDTPSQIGDLIDRFSVDLCEMDRKVFINLVAKTLSYDKALTTKIDFNDMCWFPFVYNLPMGLYDYVYIDERQDLNKSQLVIAKTVCRPGTGRIIAVGDENQALYSWRLADNSIIDEIKKQSKTKILPLPISYRCPQVIIDLAKNWVADISCPDTAITGEIKDISLNELYKLARPGCFILSRTNAPLIKICMSLIRNNVKANIRGRDVGQQLNHLIKKSKKKQIPVFLKWLENWKNEEVARLKEKNFSPENVLDRYECLVSLCEECSTLIKVSSKIDELFDDTDENNIVILSTVHRAKGLERDDVFLLRWTFRVWFDQMHFIDKPNEEANIAYVAVTRCKKHLFIVQKSVV
jgi:DNA helicase-2/ATP-dependent DNA helicase PcrA